MYQKKEYIFNENLGVCQVTEITNISVDHRPPVQYYVLKPVNKEEKPAYIPVEHHQVVLRELISRKEAEERLASDKKLTSQEKAEAEFVLAEKRKQPGI